MIWLSYLLQTFAGMLCLAALVVTWWAVQEGSWSSFLIDATCVLVNAMLFVEQIKLRRLLDGTNLK